jgi:hypothetical protein
VIVVVQQLLILVAMVQGCPASWRMVAAKQLRGLVATLAGADHQ